MHPLPPLHVQAHDEFVCITLHGCKHPPSTALDTPRPPAVGAPQVMPVWMNMSVEVFKNPESQSKWGWVQEMYAFTLSLFKVWRVQWYLG